jgi:hypothetical protein
LIKTRGEGPKNPPKNQKKTPKISNFLIKKRKYLLGKKLYVIPIFFLNISIFAILGVAENKTLNGKKCEIFHPIPTTNLKNFDDT